MTGVNRTFKDSLFCRLFGSEEYKGYALELYNALAHTKHSNPDDIELTTIDDTVLPVTHPTGVPEDRKATVRSG